MTVTWWTAKDLALQTLPGLPTTQRKVHDVAVQQGWAQRTDKTGRRLSRPRKGRGGGLEYHYTVLPVQAVAALASRGLVMNQGAQAIVVPASEAWAAFDALPDERKAKARFRFDVLREIDALRTAGTSATGAVAQVVALHKAKARAGEGVHHAFSAATVANWRKAVRGLPKGDWLPALAPRHQGRTATAECDLEAWEILKSDYLRLEGPPTFESCWDRLQALAEVKGWTLPSSKTLRRRLDTDIPEPLRVLAREGEHKLRELYPPLVRDRSEFRALQAVNADGHRWDVFVQFPDEPKPIRPLMMCIQDLYSGKILSWRIAKNEGADTVRLAFGDLFRDHGVPDLCWLDNGRGFASKWITGGTPNRFRFTVKKEDPVGVLTALGVEVHWTRPYSGQSKPIERAFRTLCDHGATHPAFAGAYTGNSPDAKPENYGSRAVPLADFIAVVGDVIRRHNAKVGRRTRVCRGVMSYDQAYEASLGQTVIRRATEAQLRMCLLAHEALTAERRSGSLSLFGNIYWAEFLNEHRGQKLVARFDPDRLHEEPLHVYTLSGAYLGAAPIQEAAGFADAAHGRAHNRARAAMMRSHKALLEIERRYSASEVAAIYSSLPDVADDEDFTPEPTRVVRMLGGLAAAPVASPAEAAPPIMDRYAEALARQRPDHLRLIE